MFCAWSTLTEGFGLGSEICSILLQSLKKRPIEYLMLVEIRDIECDYYGAAMRFCCVCRRKKSCFSSTEPSNQQPTPRQLRTKFGRQPLQAKTFTSPPLLSCSEVCAIGTNAYTLDMTEEGSQIPACQRCRTRKIRCDHAAPKCSGCAKASSACIIIDPFTQKQYTREYIHELERKEKELLGKARGGSERSATNATPNEQADTSPKDAPSAESTTTFGGYVGESSGMK